MAVRNDFTAGEVLAAADLNDTFEAKVDYALPVNTQTGTTYTFVLADALRLTTANNAAASTYTIPPQASVVWLDNSVIRVVNYGAGVVTIAGGSGVTVTNATKTLAQFESAALIRTASNAWTLVPFSGGGLSWATITATTGSPTTGTYTADGVLWRYYSWTGNGSVTVGTAGVIETVTVGGGAYNGDQMGGRVVEGILRAPSGTHTVTIGAGGAINGQGGSSQAGTWAWAGNIGSSPNGSSQYYTGAGRPGAGGTNPWITSLTGAAQNVGGSSPNTGRGSTSVAGLIVMRIPA